LEKFATLYRTEPVAKTKSEKNDILKTTVLALSPQITVILLCHHQVFDARSVETPQEMFEALLTHIDYAASTEGNPSTMTIFKHRTSPGKDFRIWNLQLIKYAGYRQEDGSIIGDPASAEFTEVKPSLFLHSY
jgi:nitric oxide synthase oxygenase domain/subunit